MFCASNIFFLNIKKNVTLPVLNLTETKLSHKQWDVPTLIRWGNTFFAALNWSCLEKACKLVLPNLRMRRSLVKLSGFVVCGQSSDRVSKLGPKK